MPSFRGMPDCLHLRVRIIWKIQNMTRRIEWTNRWRMEGMQRTTRQQENEKSEEKIETNKERKVVSYVPFALRKDNNNYIYSEYIRLKSNKTIHTEH